MQYIICFVREIASSNGFYVNKKQVPSISGIENTCTCTNALMIYLNKKYHLQLDFVPLGQGLLR